MLYARIVLGIPVEGPFDYIVPDNLVQKIKVGSRVWVNFGAKKKAVGYCVGLTGKTKIKRLKSITSLIDETPVLDKNILALTRELSDYYCCSWGEAIETALPEGLRKGKAALKAQEFTAESASIKKPETQSPAVTLLHDLEGRERWDIYLSQIKSAIENKKRALILLPDINKALRAKEIVSSRLNLSAALMYRKQPNELEAWQEIKSGNADIVVGTRSSIFAPLNNLGLVIMDEEENSVYKQDQVPHYHAREAALMRINLDGASLLLGSASPSLESIYLAKKGKIKYSQILRRKNFPDIKIVDLNNLGFDQRKKGHIFTKFLQDSIYSTLETKGKVLLFLNRKGFATSASCNNCGKALKCDRCNTNLVYHFEEDILKCHYCNFKMELPKICPQCNAGYIKFGGIGTEKIESELSRIFPQARIKRFDGASRLDIGQADIFVATSAIINEPDLNFDLIEVLGIDNSLNRADFRAGEKTFALLSGLLLLSDKKIIIQTYYPSHYCLQALIKKDINIFYDEELKQRKQLNFSPYKHMAIVKLRGRKEEKVKQVSSLLFDKLKEANKNKSIKILSVNPGEHTKLRGNFYRQVLVSSESAVILTKFLKKHLKEFARSGIIVTVDMDHI